MATWLRNWSTSDDVSVRLLCFPGVASGAHMYRRWARSLPEYVGVLGVELPGHGARMGERPPGSLTELVSRPFLDEVSAFLDRPMAIFAHSMGALVALELCGRLGRSHDWRPALFVAAACAAPDAEHAPPEAAHLTDAEVVEFLRDSGGTSTAVLADQEVVDLVVPLVRAELAMAAGYRFSPDRPLNCPIRVYLGADDPSVSAATARGWRRYGRGETVTRTFPGGHFFFQSDEHTVLRRLHADLDAVLSDQTGAHRRAARA